MFLSVFDIFKVGVGPSSSHTVGPMVAAGRFLAALRAGADRIPGAGAPARLGCRLHGSLAFTGKGHATDRAVILGLAGFDPADFDAAARGRGAGSGSPPTGRHRPARPAGDGLRRRRATSSSTTGRRCPATPTASCSRPGTRRGNLHMQETYYSVGGGFVLTARELDRPPRGADGPAVPHPFRSAAELLARAAATGLEHRRAAARQRAGAASRRPRSTPASRGSGR